MKNAEHPSESQQCQLASMTEIITGSSGARALAQTLWEFFEFRLQCELPPKIDKEQPSFFHIEIEPFLKTHRPGDLAPRVVIQDSPRREEALVHELLHLNLIKLGYPRFYIINADRQKWNLAKGILNIADHQVILPTFMSFGYSEDQFRGPSRPLTECEQRVKDHLEQLKSELCSPKGYERVVGDYLQRNSIEHKPLWIAEMIRS